MTVPGGVLNLSFLPSRKDCRMADESDFERTEAASPRRLEQARLAGRVVRSTEVVSLALLIVLSVALMFLMPAALSVMAKPLINVLSFDHAQVFSIGLEAPDLLRPLLAAVLGLLAITAAIVFATVAVGGLVFAPAAAQFDAGRVSPARGFSRLFSLSSGFDALRSAGRLILVLVVIYIVIFLSAPLSLTPHSGVMDALGLASAWAGRALLMLAAALAGLTVLEIVVRHWLYQRAERMTRAEILQEYREAEGDPELKAQIEARRRAWAQERR